MTGVVEIDFGVMRRTSKALNVAEEELGDAAARANSSRLSASAFGLMNAPLASAIPPIAEIVGALVSIGAGACASLAANVDAAREMFEAADADASDNYSRADADLAGQGALR